MFKKMMHSIKIWWTQVRCPHLNTTHFRNTSGDEKAHTGNKEVRKCTDCGAYVNIKL